MSRFSQAIQMALCAGFLTSLALVGGCSDPNPATSVSPEEAKARSQEQQDAMKKAFGPSGVPTGAKPKK